MTESVLKEGIEFWHQHPDVLATFRAHAGERCEWCGGDKWVWVEGVGGRTCPCHVIELEQEQTAKYRLLSHVRQDEKSLSLSGLVPRDDKGWSVMQAAIDSLRSLITSPYTHQWIKLTGLPGCGKSHALVGAYNQITYAAVYIQAGRLADRIHQGLDLKGEHTDEWLEINALKEALVEVPVLFLDDLGAEHDAAFVNSTITDIIVRRYQCGPSRPTVVATNLGPKDMMKRYPRLEDRLEDSLLVKDFYIRLESYRKQKGKDGK